MDDRLGNVKGFTLLEIMGVSENARLAAVRNNADVFIQFYTDNRIVNVYLDDTNPADPVNIGAYNADDTLLGSSPSPVGFEFARLFNTATDVAVTFNSRGFSDISGDICLKNSNDTYKGASLTLAG